MIAILTITYIIPGILAALIFYAACIVAGRADSGEEGQHPAQNKQEPTL